VYGLDEAAEHAHVFHAGTAAGKDGSIVTSGGRVFVAVGSGEDIAAARDKAYAAVEKISFKGAHCRTDIATRALSTGARK
jgi:phosphoribosylamine--glycine ligase